MIDRSRIGVEEYTAARAEPGRDRPGPALIDQVGPALLIVLIAAFALLTTLVMSGQTDRFDAAMIRATHSLLSPTLTRVMHPISVVGGKVVVLLPVLVLGLLAQRRPRAALVVLVVGGSAVALNTPLKVLVHRSPPGPLALPPLQWSTDVIAIQRHLSNNYSFPSGHVVGVIVVAGLVTYLARPWLPDRAFWLAVGGAGLAVAVIGFSRVYLGTYHPPRTPGADYYARHYPTDVLGGCLLGAAWLVVAILALRRLARPGMGQREAATSPARPRSPETTGLSPTQ